MITLERFPARSRLRCCATCRAWTLRRTKYRRTIVWCDAVGQIDDRETLEACGCAQWAPEQRESFALALYDELSQEGAT